MEFTEVIARRHSVRKFTDEPVDRAILDTIINMAQTAPSSKNSHSTVFMVVDEPDTLMAMSQMREHGSRFLAGAPAAIVVLGDESKTDLWVDNCSISATFLQLAATDMELGSCWVHVNQRLRSNSDPSLGYAEDYLRSLLGIRECLRIHCVVALGHELCTNE